MNWDQTVQDRFWSQVQPSEDGLCWLWTGATSGNGYGYMSVARKSWRVHRFAWTSQFGDIPPGLVLDHLCRRLLCVNPWHLEPVTQRENMLRGQSPGALAVQTNRCKYGHSLDDARPAWNNAGRQCKPCAQRIQRESKRRRRAALKAARQATA